jgi:hypothetical protein
MTHLPHHGLSGGNLQERFCRGFMDFSSGSSFSGATGNNDFLDNRLHSALPRQNASFLNWNGSLTWGKKSAIFPMPRRYT